MVSAMIVRVMVVITILLMRVGVSDCTPDMAAIRSVQRIGSQQCPDIGTERKPGGKLSCPRHSQIVWPCVSLHKACRRQIDFTAHQILRASGGGRTSECGDPSPP